MFLAVLSSITIALFEAFPLLGVLFQLAVYFLNKGGVIA